ncbi:MAG: sensor histidine kinase N-terminal domain-containing protein, partial [Ideonella sp.]|nr:sensor histidine kinase N-terminal domain-containing protein [Ideonella sp.]
MSPRSEPRLQRKLLAGLLGPLAALMVLDTGIAYWNAQRFSDIAYDRALLEIGREIALHVRLEDGRPRLDLSDDAGRVLLQDQDDRLHFRVLADDGRLVGGDPAMPPATAARDDRARFSTDTV